MLKQLATALRVTLLFTILTGLIYPGVVTGLCQLLFRGRADGSLVTVNGRIVGSGLIGQNFARPEYFQSRPSAAGSEGYDPTSSGGSNLGPTSQKLMDRVKASVEKFRKDNPDFSGPIPADLVTASASGLDPDISPDAAYAQAARIAKARGAAPDKVRRLIASHIRARQLGFLGDPRVNVLELNLALDREFALK